MPSTVWKGSLSFGLVNIPVGLHTATTDKTVRFHQLEQGTADRVRNKRVNERTGEEVDYTDIVKGYELGGGEYVVVTQEELEAASPEQTRTIDIAGFVDLDEIDPIFYKSAYYLAPDGEAAPRAYALLREMMHDADKVAVATFVLRNKEHLVTVRAREDVLVLETMHFADEIRRPKSEIPTLPEDVDFTARERETARMLLDSMTRPWDPEEYRDTYRARVEDIVDRKRRGETITAEPAPERAPVIDLVEALQASIDRADGQGDGSARGRGARKSASSSGASRRRASQGNGRAARAGGTSSNGARRGTKATKATSAAKSASSRSAKVAKGAAKSAKKAEKKRATAPARRRAS